MDTTGNMLRRTQKLYYSHPYLAWAATHITRLHPGAIELAATVAYPEGGGQEADTGTLTLATGTVVRFVWAKKLYGTPIELEGFKGGKVGGIILHEVHPADLHLLGDCAEGMAVTVSIDVQRRARLTLAHSASHFLYAAAVSVRAALEQWTIGCHIKEGSARFDFLVDEPFSTGEVEEIQRRANEWISRDGAIAHHAVQGCEDARVWVYEGIEIPCGGTHLSRPACIGALKVRRKRLGKGKERLMCEFPDAAIDMGAYHGSTLP